MFFTHFESGYLLIIFCYGASIKDSIKLKSAFQNIISSSLLIVEAKQVKSRITKNITAFQIKLIHKLINVNHFCKVLKFHVRTTRLGDFY